MQESLLKPAGVSHVEIGVGDARKTTKLLATLLKYYMRHVQKNLFMAYVNIKGADQPAHPRSLISTFVARILDGLIPILAIFEISRL